MTAWFAFIWLLVFSASLAWGIGVLASSAWAPFLSTGSLEPAIRRRRCLMTAALPWLLPAIVALSVVLLGIAKPVGIIITDHCPYHGPGHPHLCFGHLPAIAPGMTLHAATVILISAFVLVAARYVVRQRRLGESLRSVLVLARRRGRLRVIDDARALAFSAAAPAPSILMTTGLLAKLDRRQRRIVLAHEVAHLRHRDLFWNRIFEFLLIIHSPWAARSLRRSWRQALEERADDAVADRFGGETVARTLLALIKSTPYPAVSALSATGGNALRRIDRMLEPQTECAGRRAIEITYAIALILLPVFIVSSHHSLETLLGILLSL